MKSLKYAIINLLLLGVHGSFAQDDSLGNQQTFLTLQSLIQQVETTYPEVLKYEERMKSFEAKAEGAMAWMPPTFSSGINRFPYTFQGMNEEGPMNQAALMFTFNQMIPNPHKLQAKSEYYLSLGAIEKQQSEWTKNELRTIARKLYYQRYVAEQKLIVIQESEELLKLFIQSAESRYAYNKSDLGSIYKAKAKLEEFKNMRLMEESMIAESAIGINTLLNRDVYTAFKIDSMLTLTNYPSVLTQDTLFRSDISAMRSMIEAMEKEKGYMKSFSKPDFGIEVQHMQMFGMPEQFSVMGMITIPIVPWSSGMYKSDVKAMEFQINSGNLQIQSMELMARQMTAENLAMFQFMREQHINFQSNIIPAFEENMNVNLIAFQENTGDFFVLLDAWEMLLMKKMEGLDLLQRAFQLQTDYEFQAEIK